MGIFRHYLTMALFSFGLLFGVQAPNFVDQYEKRIDAHLIEARVQLAGFSNIAVRIYDGDINKLIERHADSDDEAFKAERQILKENYDRLERFEAARDALNTPLASKVMHILFFPEKDALKETIQNYTTAFPLTTDAVLCGLAGALCLCIIFELVVGAIGFMYRRWIGVRFRRDIDETSHRILRKTRAPKRS